MHSGIAHSVALGLQVLLKMVNVAQQEVATGEQRLHFVFCAHALILNGAASLETRVLDRLDGHGARTVEHARRLVASLCRDAVGLRTGLHDRCIGGALGQQQGAADHVGVATVTGGGCLTRVAGGLLRDLLQLGHGGPSPGLHRCGLVLGGLDRSGYLRTKRLNFVGVVTLLDGLESGTANRLRADVHAAMLGALRACITPTEAIRRRIPNPRRSLAAPQA